MGAWHDTACLRPHPSGWEVAHDTAFGFGGQEWVIPAGRITDLASVPRLFWFVFPPFGLYTHAAIIHDEFYERGETPRIFADRAFLAFMVIDGEMLWRAAVMYRIVRLLGWIPWRRRRRLRRT